MKAILLWTMSPLLLLVSLLNLPSGQPVAKQSAEPSILVFSATRGFRHASIPDGIKAIGTIAAKNKWTMVATEDSSVFSPEQLGKFSAIVLLNTTGNVFGPKEEAALQQYVRAGGGVVGVHAAADCEYDWPWYNQLIGGYFESHPAIQSATLIVKERHSTTAHLGSSWLHKDEWYNYKSVSPAIKVLLELDEKSYQGGKMGASHPIAWYQEFDGGRLFYTGLGHTSEAYQDEKFLMHVTEGIRWAMKKK
jgi:type 1 glutamine amidotransferase